MSNQRITPHRAKREEAKAKEVTDLKRENNKLKRAVKRLEKEVNKRESMVVEAAEAGLQSEGAPIVEKTIMEHICPTCESDCIRSITLLGNTYRICRDCGWRKRD